jgi:hypothetical protein
MANKTRLNQNNSDLAQFHYVIKAKNFSIIAGEVLAEQLLINFR